LAGARFLLPTLAWIFQLAATTCAQAQPANSNLRINEGEPDRSRVLRLVLELPPGRVMAAQGLEIQSLTTRSQLAPGTYLTAPGATPAQTVVTFPTQPGQSLPDGNYLLSVLTRAEGGGAQRQGETFLFHAWFGDHDGDRDVDFLDTAGFRQTWNLSSGDAGFDASFDSNGDGSVNQADNLRIQANYFKLLPSDAAILAHLIVDDGAVEGDGVTNNLNVEGRIVRTADTGTATLRGEVRRASAAAPDPGLPFAADLTSDLASPTAFALSESRLQALNGAALEDGVPYRLFLQLLKPNNTVAAAYSLPFTITPGRGNSPPDLIPPGDRLIAPSLAFSTTLFATDADAGDTLTFSLVSGPSGLTVNPSSGRLDWTPPANASGPQAVSVAVTDSEGASDSGSFTITVAQPETGIPDRSAPVLTVPANGLLVTGNTFSASASATDADPGDVLAFSLPAAPDGMAIDPSSGAVTWTPLAGVEGTREATVRVTDSFGLSDVGTFAVTVTVSNRAPVAVNDSYITPKGSTTTISAPGVIGNDTDPDGNPLTATLVSGVRNGTLDFRPDGSFDYRPGTPAPIQARLAYGFHRLSPPGESADDFGINGINRPVAADLDGDGKPEIIAVGQKGSGIGNTGWLAAIKLDEAAKTMSQLWTYKGGAGLNDSIYNAREPAVGDVNGDGKPEVVVGGQCRGEILIFSNTGELLVNTQADKSVGPGTLGGPDCFVGGNNPPLQIADLDGDGAAEIITQYRGNGLRVYNGQGGVVWESMVDDVAADDLGAGPLIADVDLDGKLNIFFAGVLFDADGTRLWVLPGIRSRYSDQFTAVANLDDDPYGEIVISYNRNPNVIRVVEHDGSCKWVAGGSNPPSGSGCIGTLPFPNANGPNQRALLIADLLGDGKAKIIAVSAESSYNHVTVFNQDGSILWQIEASIGGNVMGQIDAAAFDFNGDGIMEVVISGRLGTIFVSGLDGSTVSEIPWDEFNPGRPAASPWLNPIVVDMENDGHAELVIAGRDSAGGPKGIFVYKDVNDRWMPTRSVWNQQHNSVTNVNSDGTIPRRAEVNWLTPGLNSYGVNSPAPGDPSSSDSFTYRISDGSLTSNDATVTLEIRKPNNPPVILSAPRLAAVPDFAYRYNVFATDPDVGDSVTISYLHGPAGMTLGEGNVVRWTPLAADLGEHTVTLAAKDKEGDTTLQTFTLRVIPFQLVPDVVGRTQSAAISTLEDAGFVGGRITREDHPTTPAGSVIRQFPLAGASELPGTAVALVISNGKGPGNPGGNRGPVAVNDVFATPKGVTTTIRPAGVINNDTDPDGSPLTAELVSGPRNGTLALRPDGSFDYTPGTGKAPFQPKLAFAFNKLDGVPYRVNNWVNNYDTGNVSVADLDGDGKPEIIAIGQRYAGIASAGWLVALKLDESTNTLTPLWTYHNAAALHSAGEPAVGDVTGDGIPEVVVGTVCSGQIMIFSNTGQLLLDQRLGNESDCEQWGGFSPEIADLDGDGLAEIIIAYKSNSIRVYRATGEVVWERQAAGTAAVGNRILIADVDLDGELNVYHAGILYDAHGNQLWRLQDIPNRIHDWGVAAVNLDDDPFAEIVKLSFRPPTLRVIEHDGSCKWVASSLPFPPSGSDCGTPLPFLAAPDSASLIVADLNGDGQPEILVGSTTEGLETGNSVTAFNRDGTILWQTEATVGSTVTTMTNLAAFDFTGDGTMEIVVSGRLGTCFLSGADGTKLSDIPWDAMNPGRPASQAQLNPIIVDLENDGHAELVIAGRDSNIDPNSGIFVYKDVADNWMPTRTIWNQARYNITNVNADGSIPRKPLVNWLTPGLNNYGINVPAPGEASSTDSFTYQLNDGEFTSNVATVTLEVRKPNRPPVFLSTPRLAAVPDYEYRYNIFTTDPDVGDAVTVSTLNGPAGMTLGEGNVLRWTPLVADLGEHTVTLAAKDKEGDTTLQTFTLRVIPAQLVPNVVAQTQAVALTTIDGAGFTAGQISREDHPSVPAGSVISQLPLAGASEPPNTAVALVVSNGPGPGYTDGDGDGFTPNQGDCDDGNPGIFPGAPDPEGDGIDQDCNGIDGKLVLASILVEPADPRVLTNQNVPLTATGIFTDGTSQNLTAVVTWSSGEPRFSGATPGNFPVTATLNSITGSTTITVVEQVADAAPPLAEITTPASGSTVTGPVEVRGSAGDPNFLKYELAMAIAGTENFTVFATGNNPVSNGVLGTFDPTVLINDQYTIRLTVHDRGRNKSTAETTVLVDENMKVGNFSLTFTDLQIPLSGIPISVTRTYDSRDKERGDFGVGWRLGIQSLKLRSNRIPGSGWNVIKPGLSFALQETDAHIVGLTLPDGRVEIFDLIVSPRVSPLVPFPPSVLNAKFVPRAGTLGRLESLENNTLSIFDSQPGPVELLDDISLGAYNPQRFRYTAPDGTSIVIHAKEGVQRITEPNGNTLNFTPGGIFHSSGKSVLFTRDDAGRITSVTDPMGSIQRYTYDGNGDLRSHTDAAGNVTRYAYNRSHGLLRITDPLDRVVARSEYDDSGRLIRMTNANGGVINFTHDLNTRQEIITDAGGQTTVMEYDTRGNVLRTTDALGGVTTNTYDADGNQLTTTNPEGETTTRTFDSRRNLLTEKNALGETTTLTYNNQDKVTSRTDPLGRITRFEYTATGNLKQTINALGVVSQRNDYDAKGNLIASTDARGHTTQYEYDASGNQTATIDAKGARSTTQYNARGDLIKETDRNGTTMLTTVDSRGYFTQKTDPLGNISRFTFNAVGVMSDVTDPMGNVTRQEVDATGKDLSFTDATQYKRSKTYDIRGNVTGTPNTAGETLLHEYDELSRRVRTVNPDGGAVRQIYDKVGRVIRTVDALGNESTMEYDDAGRNTRITDALGHETRFSYDAAGNLVQQTDAKGNVFHFDYDALDRRTRIRLPDGTAQLTAYDAADNIISETDAAGHVTTYSYDAAGSLQEITDPLGGKTRLEYDADGNLLKQTDANGNATRFAYDANGRRIRKTYPDGTVEKQAYDTGGRTASITDAEGRSTLLEYDASGRPLRKVFADGTSESFTYTPAGQVSTATNATGTVSYAYDANDRLVKVTQADGASIAYSYDLDGNRTSVTTQLAGGPARVTNFTFDALNRIATVTDPEGAVTRNSYDEIGNLASVSYPNGVISSYTYDSLSRLTLLAHRKGANAIASYAYVVNAVGDRTRVTSADSSFVDYDYDARRQLTRESYFNPAGAKFAEWRYLYDSAGNRRSVVDMAGIETPYSYDAADKLLNAGSTAFAYDARGNAVSRSSAAGSTAYAFNPENELTRVDAPAGSVAFGYDATGERTSTQGPGAGEMMNHLVDLTNASGVSQVLVDHDTTGTPLAEYTYGNELIGQRRGGSAHYHHRDGSRNVRLLSDSAGAASDTYAYNAFGERLSRSGTTTNPYQFAGDRYGELDSLVFLRARYYDPSTGRFISKDPFEGVLRDPVSLHRYLYANANPVSFVDPTGEYVTAQELGVAASISAGISLIASGIAGETVWEAIPKAIIAAGFGVIGGAAGARVGAYFLGSSGQALAGSIVGTFARKGLIGFSVIFTKAAVGTILSVINSVSDNLSGINAATKGLSAKTIGGAFVINLAAEALTFGLMPVTVVASVRRGTNAAAADTIKSKVYLEFLESGSTDILTFLRDKGGKKRYDMAKKLIPEIEVLAKETVTETFVFVGYISRKHAATFGAFLETAKGLITKAAGF
jgi:RHS repeat-associated protein